MTGDSTAKVLSDQFNKLGVISQAEFENQRCDKVGTIEERHEVANEDDLQFELDDTDKSNTAVAKDTVCPAPANDGNHLSDHSKLSVKVTSPKHIDNTSNQRERESLYWLDNSARFYPVPIRPHPNIVKHLPKVG